MSSSQAEILSIPQPKPGTKLSNLDALETEVFDENNPGPSFEEVFPEYAVPEEFEYYVTEDDQEIELAHPYEYFLKESENCECCQGFIYNCEGVTCIENETCNCTGGSKPEPIYFQTYKGENNYTTN